MFIKYKYKINRHRMPKKQSYDVKLIGYIKDNQVYVLY